LLSLVKQSQKNDLTVRAGSVVVRPRDAPIDLAKDCGLVLDRLAFRHKRIRLTSLAKDNSVPGSKPQHARFPAQKTHEYRF
jgi:hypothetical protein